MTVYGHRIDRAGKHIRWPTIIQPDQGVDFETPNGIVSVWQDGDDLYIWNENNTITIRGVTSNMIRVGVAEDDGASWENPRMRGAK